MILSIVNFFLKSSIGWEVIKLCFFEFPAILLLFLETYAHFKMLHLLKQLSFSKTFSILVSIPLGCLKIICLLRHYLNFQVCYQSCDVTFPPKTFKIEKQQTYDYCLSTKFYRPANFELKRIRTVNWSSSQSAVSDKKLTRRDKCECAFEKKKDTEK